MPCLLLHPRIDTFCSVSSSVRVTRDRMPEDRAIDWERPRLFRGCGTACLHHRWRTHEDIRECSFARGRTDLQII